MSTVLLYITDILCIDMDKLHANIFMLFIDMNISYRLIQFLGGGLT